MRVFVQRVSRAAVRVDDEVVGTIGLGLLLYVAVEVGDGESAIEWMAEKISHLRIFQDTEGKLNRSVLDVRGDILAVSAFTLAGDARRGRRPSFDRSAPAAEAGPLFQKFVDKLTATGLRIETGRFQTVMQIESMNEGPVTLLLDTR